MLISMNTGAFNRFGDIRTILKMMKEAGFDAYDFSLVNSTNAGYPSAEHWEEEARAVKEYADDLGIVCNQAHAPFASWLKGNEEYNAAIFPEIERAIRVSGIVGAKVCVVHPCNRATPEENAQFYRRLLPVAKESGVKIGVENMWNWDDGRVTPAACSDGVSFNAHLDLLDERYFGALLDIGHAEMQGVGTSAVEMINALNSRLIALHIHDNNQRDDSHVLPFTMNIDFSAVCAALKGIGYQGDVTLEVFFKQQMPLELFPTLVKHCAELANYLRNQIK